MTTSWKCWGENLIPADHMLMKSDEYLEDPLVEITLKSFGVLKLVISHECSDPGVRLPFGRPCLVASDVHVGVREDSCHLAKEALDELVGLLPGGIQSEVGDTELTAD